MLGGKFSARSFSIVMAISINLRRDHAMQNYNEKRTVGCLTWLSLLEN
jgi:hypothetical protein